VDISWGDLGAAVALMLIIEGIMPFVNPRTFRQMLEMVSKMEERSVRTLGAVWIGLGIALLYWVRG
jgi:uncharacterized protein YjeT (DUF2065 family)